MSYIELLGTFAGLCTTFSFLPQLIHIINSRSAKDISLSMYIILVIGLVSWLTYGIIIGSPSMIGTNIITLIFALIIITLKIIWKEK